MYQYVALAWTAKNEQSVKCAEQLGKALQAADSAWIQSFIGAGLAVYTKTPPDSASKIYRLGETGLLLGCLFSGEGASVPTDRFNQIVGPSAKTLRQVTPQQLVKQYWGSYVALLSSPATAGVQVVRDPSGKIPCYHASYRTDVELIFSDITSVARFLSPSIDYDYIAAFLFYPELQVRGTALRGVQEVLAGELLNLSPGKPEQQCLWHPMDICGEPELQDFESAAIALRETAQQCINVWAPQFRNIVLQLSGGLDSAIVLGCLANTPARETLTCLNIFGETSSDDERYFARLAADRANVKLVEEPCAAHIFDERQFRRPLECKPSITSLFATLQRPRTNELVSRSDSNSVWDGQGGDHNFMESGTTLAASDYLRQHRIGLGLLRVVADSGKLAFEPYLSVLLAAVRNRKIRRQWRPERRSEHEIQFMNPRRRDGLEEKTLHPWQEATESLPLGKQLQIFYLAEVLNRHRPLPGYEAAQEHHPLLSQPIVELCLRAPTYLHVHKGRDRALARHAFAEIVPAAILARTGKGDMSFTITDSIRRSELFLRELILDGLLSGQGLIHVPAFEHYIVKRQTLRVETYRPLLALIAAEIFIRRWQSSSVRAAA